jgi:Forkhead domain
VGADFASSATQRTSQQEEQHDTVMNDGVAECDQQGIVPAAESQESGGATVNLGLITGLEHRYASSRRASFSFLSSPKSQGREPYQDNGGGHSRTPSTRTSNSFPSNAAVFTSMSPSHGEQHSTRSTPRPMAGGISPGSSSRTSSPFTFFTEPSWNIGVLGNNRHARSASSSFTTVGTSTGGFSSASYERQIAGEIAGDGGADVCDMEADNRQDSARSMFAMNANRRLAQQEGPVGSSVHQHLQHTSNSQLSSPGSTFLADIQRTGFPPSMGTSGDYLLNGGTPSTEAATHPGSPALRLYHVQSMARSSTESAVHVSGDGPHPPSPHASGAVGHEYMHNVSVTQEALMAAAAQRWRSRRAAREYFSGNLSAEHDAANSSSDSPMTPTMHPVDVGPAPSELKGSTAMSFQATDDSNDGGYVTDLDEAHHQRHDSRSDGPAFISPYSIMPRYDGQERFSMPWTHPTHYGQQVQGRGDYSTTHSNSFSGSSSISSMHEVELYCGNEATSPPPGLAYINRASSRTSLPEPHSMMTMSSPVMPLRTLSHPVYGAGGGTVTPSASSSRSSQVDSYLAGPASPEGMASTSAGGPSNSSASSPHGFEQAWWRFDDPQAELKKLLPKDRKRALERPKANYITLLRLIILTSPRKRVTLNEIYTCFETYWPYFRHVASPASVRNSIRNALSLNQAFESVPRDPDEEGKGGYWVVNENVEPLTIRRKTTKKRKANT